MITNIKFTSPSQRMCIHFILENILRSILSIFYALFQKMEIDYLRLDIVLKELVKRACWRSDSDLYEHITYSPPQKSKTNTTGLAYTAKSEKAPPDLLGHHVGSGI